MLYNFFLIYFTGVAAVAVSRAFHVFFRFDEYDRKHREIKLDFILSSLLWPLLLFNPRHFFCSEHWFELGKWGAEEARLRDNPPPVGDTLLFLATCGEYIETYGEFTLTRKSILEYLRKQRLDEPSRYFSRDRFIEDWLEHHYDPSITTLTVVPEVWTDFAFTVNDLARKGLVTVRCTQCQQDFSTDRLLIKDDRGLPGWNADRMTCPAGHPLLALRRTHYTLASNSAENLLTENDDVTGESVARQPLHDRHKYIDDWGWQCTLNEPWLKLGDEQSLNEAGREQLTKLHEKLRPIFRAIEATHDTKCLSVSLYGYWLKEQRIYLHIRLHSVLQFAFHDYEIDLEKDNIRVLSESVRGHAREFVQDRIEPLFQEYEYLNTLSAPFSVNIEGADGKPLASNLMVVLDPGKLPYVSPERMLPLGACTLGYFTGSLNNSLFLNLEDFSCVYETRDASGCCGPAGLEWNIVSPEGVALGKEFSDCTDAHYVIIENGSYTVVFNREDHSVVLGEVFESAEKSLVAVVVSGGDYQQASERLSLMVADFLEENEEDSEWLKAANRKTIQYRPCTPESEPYWIDHWILNKYRAYNSASTVAEEPKPAPVDTASS